MFFSFGLFQGKVSYLGVIEWVGVVFSTPNSGLVIYQYESYLLLFSAALDPYGRMKITICGNSEDPCFSIEDLSNQNMVWYSEFRLRKWESMKNLKLYFVFGILGLVGIGMISQNFTEAEAQKSDESQKTLLKDPVLIEGRAVMPVGQRGDSAMAFKDIALSEETISKYLKPDEEGWYKFTAANGDEVTVSGYYYSERIDEPWQANVHSFTEKYPLPKGRYYSTRAPEWFHITFEQENGEQSLEAYDSWFPALFVTDFWACSWLEESILADELGDRVRADIANSMLQQYETVPYNRSIYPEFAQEKADLIRFVKNDSQALHKYAFSKYCEMYEMEVIDG